MAIGCGAQIIKILLIVFNILLSVSTFFISIFSLAGLPAVAVDGWAVTFGTARKVRADCGPAQSHPHCTKCNSPPVNGQYTNHRIAVHV